MAVVNDFDLFVGGQSGTFKGISIDLKNNNKKPITKNCQNVKALTKESEVTALSWGNSEENEVLIGSAGQKVKIYDVDFKAFTNNIHIQCGTGSIKGISRYKKHILTAIESGEVQVWSHKKEHILKTGNQIEKMRHSPFNGEIIATGGKENDLKFTSMPIVVRPDMLELRVPIWVSDMDFLPDTSKVAVCTRHGHIRLYDPSTPQRRPVVNFDIPEECLTSMSIYLKSRLNCILLKSDAFLKIKNESASFDIPDNSDDDVQIIQNDYDELFDNMETVEELPPKKKKKINK
ncbi:hypothetical protein C0J52_17326 [Blattella germanica]|nr:hypothetical protein C0J52_17326 [Blattella germanica]